MIRIVIDTNVIVSALLNDSGSPAAVFLLFTGGAVQLCVSGQVYAEYEEVIRRPRFGRDPEITAELLQTIREKSFWVKPLEKIEACLDPADDIFLECAQAARAEFLVTGNLRHFPQSFDGTLVITPRRFIDFIAGESAASQGQPT